MRIKDLLDQQGRKFFTIPSDLTVEDAINLMTQKQIRCLIVVEADHPVGIFTERDVLVAYVKHKRRPFADIKLRDAMTNKIIVAEPEDEITASIALMVRADVRHLPVVEEGKITAILYICDLVQHQVGTLAAELHYLEDYLADLHDAAKD